MKKVLINFAEGILSREQMRVIKGGDYYDGYGGGSQYCRVCSSGGPGGNSGACGDYVVPEDDVDEFVNFLNDYSNDGYTYDYDCIEQP